MNGGRFCVILGLLKAWGCSVCSAVIANGSIGIPGKQSIDVITCVFAGEKAAFSAGITGLEKAHALTRHKKRVNGLNRLKTKIKTVQFGAVFAAPDVFRQLPKGSFVLHFPATEVEPVRGVHFRPEPPLPDRRC